LPPDRAGWQTATMLQAIGAIVFIVLAYTVLVLGAHHLPVSWQAGVPFVVPLIALAGAAFALAPKGRKR
jgi:hypothetical protein